ncbi:hypothetical protein JXB31_02090 [Candidatus Woesearchaeota archaeon]|nr:hypothetical protein [Candidatus Woesearchaeota archaeon]
MKLTKLTTNLVFVFCFLLSGALTVSAANLGYWGGIVALDGNQVNDSYDVSVFANDTKIREDQLGAGPEVPSEYYLLVVEESKGEGKDITFTLKQTGQADSCALQANENPQVWALGANNLDLSFNKLADNSGCSCNFVCTSGNCNSGHCCPTGLVWCGSSCMASCGGGSGGGGGSSGTMGTMKPPQNETCIPQWTCTEWFECIDGVQKRVCVDSNMCGNETEIPVQERACEQASTTGDTGGDLGGQGDQGDQEGDGNDMLGGAGDDGSSDDSSMQGITGAVVGGSGKNALFGWLIILAFVVLAGLMVYYKRDKLFKKK